MSKTVFYSWISEHPNSTNRSFIQTALERAIARINKDGPEADLYSLDRDTLGLPGSPNIIETIYKKIEDSCAFVCDVSFVGTTIKEKRTPNPNVLIELGYAMRAIGIERVIMLFNEIHGKIEELPFDIRANRILSYSIDENEEQKADKRKQIENVLFLGLKQILGSGDNGIDLVPNDLAPEPQMSVGLDKKWSRVDLRFKISVTNCGKRVIENSGYEIKIPRGVLGSYVGTKMEISSLERHDDGEILVYTTSISKPVFPGQRLHITSFLVTIEKQNFVQIKSAKITLKVFVDSDSKEYEIPFSENLFVKGTELSEETLVGKK